MRNLSVMAMLSMLSVFAFSLNAVAGDIVLKRTVTVNGVETLSMKVTVTGAPSLDHTVADKPYIAIVEYKRKGYTTPVSVGSDDPTLLEPRFVDSKGSKRVEYDGETYGELQQEANALKRSMKATAALDTEAKYNGEQIVDEAINTSGETFTLRMTNIPGGKTGPYQYADHTNNSEHALLKRMLDSMETFTK